MSTFSPVNAHSLPGESFRTERGFSYQLSMQAENNYSIKLTEGQMPCQQGLEYADYIPCSFGDMGRVVFAYIYQEFITVSWNSLSDTWSPEDH